MRQWMVLAVWLAAILAFFCPVAQERLRALFGRRPACIWLAPPILTAAFAGASALVHAFSFPLTVAVLAYTCAPVLCGFLAGAGPAERPAGLDFAAILLLWFPIEFNAAESLVPRAAQGFLHTVAYGMAIVAGLTIFLCYRAFPGMKYNLPRARRDFWLPLAGFACLAPALAVLGMAIGFLPPPHLPMQHGGRMAAAGALILAGTALPEEILFRALIQNLLMLRYGESARTLFAASLIFGCAHLDNGPQPLPNWRYMILATMAGWAYGKVFQRASTVLSSVALHMLVDWTKHFFF